jgi:hypothetical protein
VQLEREDRTEEDKHYLVALTRRKSICSIVSTGLVVPLVGVVSSSNIPVRLHLGVGSETFLGRYLSVLLSRTLPHSSTQSLWGRDPSLLLYKVPIPMLAAGTFLDIVAQYHLSRALLFAKH